LPVDLSSNAVCGHWQFRFIAFNPYRPFFDPSVLQFPTRIARPNPSGNVRLPHPPHSAGGFDYFSFRHLLGSLGSLGFAILLGILANLARWQMGDKALPYGAQVNVRMTEGSITKLKALAKADDMTIGAFIEKMLDSYSVPSKPSTPSSVSDDWHSAVAELSSRLLALERRFEGLGAAGVASMPEVESVPVVADLKPSVVAVAVDVSGETVETVAVETVKNRAVDNEAEFDALVKQYGAKEGGGFMGVQATVKALRQVAKVQAKQERVGASLERVKGVQNDGQT
jgi:hypothetical protein